jgi:hypothetical protein
MAVTSRSDEQPPRNSPADEALAAADVAAHLVSALMTRAGGSAVDLARVERVCVTLRRAGTPHWRVLCSSLSPAAAQLAAAAAGTAGVDWRRLYAQLHGVAFPAPRCRCSDFVFLVDITYADAPLFSGCAGPFAGGAHAARHDDAHWLRVAAPGGGDAPPAPVLTAGDVYDWPVRFSARVCARRLADGAMAEVARGMSLAQSPAAESQYVLDSADGVAQQAHTAVLAFFTELPARTRRDPVQDSDVTLNVNLFLQAEDAADAPTAHAADAVAPLFFRMQGYNEDGSPPHGAGGLRPRPPLHEAAGSGVHRFRYNPGAIWANGGRVEGPVELLIEEEVLARRVVLRRRGVMASLFFGGGAFREDGTPWMSQPAKDHGSCDDVCAALDRLVFVPP